MLRNALRNSAYGGIWYMVLAAVAFSVMSLLVKLAGARVPTQQIVMIRGLFTLALAYALVRQAGVPMWGNRKGLLVVRGLIGFGSLLCFYYAIIHLPLAEATVIQYSNPIWTIWLAWILIGEPLSPLAIAVSAACLAGVLLMARPSTLFGAETAALDPFVVIVALGGAFFSAAAYVTVRNLGRTEHPYVIVFYFALITVIAAVPGLALGVLWPTPWEWALLTGVGITALIGQLCLTVSLRREEAGRAVTVGYIQVIFATLLGFMFLAEYPDRWSATGALLILGSLLVLARYGRVERIP